MISLTLVLIRARDKARECLHLGTPPTSLIGREELVGELSKFIHHHLISSTPGSLYISGPPGTGKTASLNLILGAGEMTGFTVVKVNCTSVSTPQGIYRKVAEELGLDLRGCKRPALVQRLVEERLTSGEDMM
jgi:cell division control protein 6